MHHVVRIIRVNTDEAIGIIDGHDEQRAATAKWLNNQQPGSHSHVTDYTEIIVRPNYSSLERLWQLPVESSVLYGRLKPKRTGNKPVVNSYLAVGDTLTFSSVVWGKDHILIADCTPLSCNRKHFVGQVIVNSNGGPCTVISDLAKFEPHDQQHPAAGKSALRLPSQLLNAFNRNHEPLTTGEIIRGTLAALPNDDRSSAAFAYVVTDFHRLDIAKLQHINAPVGKTSMSLKKTINTYRAVELLLLHCRLFRAQKEDKLIRRISEFWWSATADCLQITTPEAAWELEQNCWVCCEILNEEEDVIFKGNANYTCSTSDQLNFRANFTFTPTASQHIREMQLLNVKISTKCSVAVRTSTDCTAVKRDRRTVQQLFSYADELLSLPKTEGMRRPLRNIYRSMLGFSTTSIGVEVPKIAEELLMGQTNEQKAVMAKASDPDNAILLVPAPGGSGKTYIIRELIRMFLQHSGNNKVLIVTVTNSAADHIMSELQKAGVPALRYYSPSVQLRPHAQYSTTTAVDRLTDLTSGHLKEHLSELLGRLHDVSDTESQILTPTALGLLPEIEEIEHQLLAKVMTDPAYPVLVATTCSLTNPAIKDVYTKIIIDEAGLVTMADFAAPVLKLSADTISDSMCYRQIILLGDIKQLPPSSSLAPPLRQFAEQSLLERFLLVAHTPTAHMKTSYRFRKKYGQSVISDIHYDGELVPGREDDPDVPNPYWFLNVADADCSSFGSSKANHAEASVIRDLVAALKVPSHKFAVLAPYSGQVKVLKQLCSKMNAEVNVSTVDSYQGQQADLIIASLVVTTASGIGFLASNQRICTLHTRAKEMMILVGQKEVCMRQPKLQKYVDVCERDGTCIQITRLSDFVEAAKRALSTTELAATPKRSRLTMTWKPAASTSPQPAEPTVSKPSTSLSNKRGAEAASAMATQLSQSAEPTAAQPAEPTAASPDRQSNKRGAEAASAMATQLSQSAKPTAASPDRQSNKRGAEAASAMATQLSQSAKPTAASPDRQSNKRGAEAASAMATQLPQPAEPTAAQPAEPTAASPDRQSNKRGAEAASAMATQLSQSGDLSPTSSMSSFFIPESYDDPRLDSLPF